MKKILLLFLGLFALSCRPSTVAVPTEVPQAQAFSLQSQLENDFSLQYLQFIPDDYNDKDNWPLLLFLHGAGERGNDLSKVAMHGPPKLAAQGKLQQFVILAPQCPAEDYWDTWQMQTSLIALLQHAERELKIDPNRIYITGLSMGGFGTWYLASAMRDKVAAAVPICGGGNVWTANFLKDVPIWAFHGAQDNVVPLSYSQNMVEAVNRDGGNAKLTVFPEANHNSWDAAYEQTPELWDWILSQNLEDRK